MEFSKNQPHRLLVLEVGPKNANDIIIPVTCIFLKFLTKFKVNMCTLSKTLVMNETLF